MARYAPLLALALWGSTSAVHAQDAPSPWHLDVDVAAGRAQTGFVSAPLPDSVCSAGDCAPVGLTAPALRLAAGFGHAGLSLEGSVAAPSSDQPTAHATASAGVRVDTGWDAPVSVFFRLAYVRRFAGIDGHGGRAGIGISVRPVMGLALYGEASADVTSVPSSMIQQGTFVAWSTFLAGGVRLSFGH